MAVEHGGCGDFFAAEGFGDGLEGEVLGLLGVEEDAAVGSEFGSGGLLEWMVSIDRVSWAGLDIVRRGLQSADR